MARREAKIGKAGENLAANRVRALGVEMVEEIGTPFVIYNRKPNNWYQGFFGKKVSGDTRGVVPGTGRSVLVETKTIMDRNLRWSDLREHQPERLSWHAELGGWSLLVWVHSTGVYIFEWPIPEDYFRHGKSMTIDIAQQLDIGVE